ncbi:MAG: hypothetical protein ACO25L_05040 [Candidatus Nanopelagicales bacterium]
MSFKQYLNQMKAEPTVEIVEMDDDSSVVEVNQLLETELDKPFVSPQSGILAIRKVLQYFSTSMPALYDIDPEGDEVTYDLDNGLSIYLIYSQTDEGYYEFYAEVGDEERMNELMSEEDNDIA